MNRGKFISIEGGEGVGKSTNIDFLRELLAHHGIHVVTTREPGGTPTAERIRQLLLEHGDERMPDIAELLLFFAARSLHIDNVIRPALADGSWVLCDRFTDATRAYQGSGRGLDREQIETLARWVQKGLQPDLTILLDAPAEVGSKRIRQRSKADRMEAEHAAFHRRVREGYLSQAAAEPGRFVIVDASQPLESVQERVQQAILGAFFSKI